MKFLPEFKSRFRILKKGNISLVVSGMLFTFASAADISNTVIVNSASAGTNGTKALLSHNGTPMVNIAKPTGTGLSKNYYDKFNIDNKGLLLNNMTAVVQTQLAGYELPNLNLGVGKKAVSASTILNEVKSTAPTTFEGYIEVGGNKAAVIIANPNGISVNGGGFINASRTSLITGSSNLNEAGDAISSFNIGENRVSISGTGLDAKDTTVLDLVAKSISIDGQINAKLLNLMAGVESYDYENHSGTTTNTTASTEYAIDASALGSMYANAITIKATNEGLGVKISSDSGAMAGDFTIDSTGKVVIGGKISAVKNTDVTVAVSATTTTPATTKIEKASEVDGEGNIKITTQNRDVDGFKLDKGSLSAEGNVEFKTGGFTLEGGQIKASNDFKVDASSLTDLKETSTVAGVNTRSANNLIDIKLSGAHTMGSDISYVANNSITYNAGTASISGMLYSKDNLSMTTSGEFASGTTGSIVSDKAFNVNAGSINNSGKLTTNSATEIFNLASNGAFANSGTIAIASDSKTLTINSSGAFANSGEIYNSLGDLSITANSTINNNGLILGANNLTLSGATTIYNSSVGAFVASNALSLNGSELSNAGTLYSDKDMTLTASSITNSATLANGGGITTAEMLTTTGNFINSGDTWAKNSTMSGATFENSGTFSIANDSTMNYTTSWKNTKNVSIGHDATITTGEFTNGGGAVSGGNIINLGLQEFYAIGKTSASTYTAFTNTGAKYGINDDTWGIVNSTITNTNMSGVTYADIYNNPDSNDVKYRLGIQFMDGTLDDIDYYNRKQAFGEYAQFKDANDNVLGQYYGWFANKMVAFNTARPVECSAGNGCFNSDYSNTFAIKVGYDTSGGGGASASVANLKSNGTLNINFTNGKNDGSIINAENINMTGTGTFTNSSIDTGYKILYYEAMFSSGFGATMDELTYKSSMTISGGEQSGGVIKANNTLNMSGFILANNKTANFQSATIDSKSANTKTNSSSLGITTPTNPNGKFVTSKNPNSQFLVESNPVYGEKAKYLGSDYLMKSLGIDPTMQTIKLLGDAVYEAKMIEQQITKKTGNALLKGMADAGTQIKSMYDNAASQAGALGLKFGETPSSAQLANLKSDMVWMVKTVVNGVEVLAPQVFLAPTTLANLALNEESGTISAKDMNMDLKSLSNTGGTIKGSDNLNIKSKGDITNASGNITGGNVVVESTDGNIKNETLTRGVMTENGLDTVTEKTATISSTKDMSLKAAKDITIKGGNVDAAGNLEADAGGKLNVQALDTKTQGKGVNYSTDVVGSTISSGKDMALSSKDDMNIEASKIKASGNLDMKTEGDMNIVAKDSTNFDHQSSGNNVKNTTTTTNRGSSIESGGNANLKAAKDITLQGSSVDAKGDLGTEATNINVLAGKNTVDSSDLTTTSNTVKKESGNWFSGKKEESTTTTKTTGTISKESNSVASSLKSGGNTKIKATNDVTIQGSNVDAGKNVDMGGTNVNILGAQNTKTSTTIDKTEVGSDKSSYGVLTGGYNKEWKNKTTNTQTTDNESKNAGSTIKSGGDMNIKATNDLTVQGSKTQADKNLNMEATNINVLAGKDTKTTDTKTTTDEQTKKLSVGVGGVSFGMEFKKGESQANTDESTAKVSTTKAGQDITKTATNKITDEGTQIDAGGDYTQKADTIENKAAKNTYTESKKASEQTIGFEVGVTTSATIKAGVNYAQENEKSNLEDSQAVVSNIKAGGNVNSSSTNKTTMEGTNIDAGKNLNIEAKSLDVLQANDTSKSSESSNGFNVNAGVEVGSSGLKGANVGFGVKNSKESLETSTARTSNLSSGGNMNIKTAQDIKMQGTNLQSAEDTNIEAGGNINMEAARDTEKSSNTGFNVGLGLSLDMGNDKAKKSQGINLDAGFATGKTNINQAVTGSIESGGNLNIKSGNNVTLEGVEVDAGGKTKVDAGGDVNLKSAESTVDSNQFGVNVGIAATLGGGRQGEALPSTENLTGVDKAKQSVKNAIDDKKDGIKSSGVSPVGFGLNIELEKGKDYKSTTINSNNGVEINAGGKVKQEEGFVDGLSGGSINGGQGGTKINAAGGVEKDTKVSYDVGIDMNINAGKDATKDGIKGESNSDDGSDAKMKSTLAE